VVEYEACLKERNMWWLKGICRLFVYTAAQVQHNFMQHHVHNYHYKIRDGECYLVPWLVSLWLILATLNFPWLVSLWLILAKLHFNQHKFCPNLKILVENFELIVHNDEHENILSVWPNSKELANFQEHQFDPVTPLNQSDSSYNF
jgi:hypothetical protein